MKGKKTTLSYIIFDMLFEKIKHSMNVTDVRDEHTICVYLHHLIPRLLQRWT